MYNIWMSLWNTTTQGLNQLISQSAPDEIQKRYLKSKFNKLVGSLKIFLSLDQTIGFIDNNLIDSGLIRGLYKYKGDPEIRLLKDELKDTLLNAADNIFYFYDGRIEKDDPESLIKERFEKTVGKYKFIHSAAFGNESNWQGIDSYHEFIKAIPEYKDIFGFLIDLLEKMPKENIIRNPQKQDTYGLMLDYYYGREKNNFQDQIGFYISNYLLDYKKPEDRTRSNLYDYADKSFHPETANAVKRLFADKLYNQIVPWVTQSEYQFKPWDDFWGTKELYDKVYKAKTEDESSDNLRISIERLFQNGKAFNFIASQKPDTISDIRKSVRSYFVSDTKNQGNLARNLIRKMYVSKRGDELNKSYTDIGLDTVSLVSTGLSQTMYISLVVPILKKVNDYRPEIEFMFLTLPWQDTEYNELIDIFEKALSKDE